MREASAWAWMPKTFCTMSPTHNPGIPEHSYFSPGQGYSLSQHFLILFWVLCFSTSFPSLSFSFAAGSKCFHKSLIRFLFCTFFLIWLLPTLVLCPVLYASFSLGSSSLGNLYLTSLPKLIFSFSVLTGSKVSLEGKPWHSKHPGIFIPTRFLVPKSLPFFSFLAYGWSEAKEDSMIADLGLMRLILSGEQPVCLQTGPLGWLPLVVAVAASIAPSARIHLHPVFSPLPTPPSTLYPDPGYQETIENQNVM